MTTPAVPKDALRAAVLILEAAAGWDKAPAPPPSFTSPIHWGLAPYARSIRNDIGWSSTPDVPRRAALKALRTLHREDERLAGYENWLKTKTGFLSPPDWVVERYMRALQVTAELRTALAEAISVLESATPHPIRRSK